MCDSDAPASDAPPVPHVPDELKEANDIKRAEARRRKAHKALLQAAESEAPASTSSFDDPYAFDFELPDSDEPTLIAKICQYVGIEIREADVYNFGKQEENTETQESS